MYCLTPFRCLCITRNVAVASLDSLPSKDTPPPAQSNSLKPPIPTSKAPTSRPKKKNKKPPVIEIERALGAGRFRDTESKNSEEVKEAAFDMFMMNFTGKFEGSVEKRLRETGAWMANQRMFRISALFRGFLRDRFTLRRIIEHRKPSTGRRSCFSQDFSLLMSAFSLLISPGVVTKNLPRLTERSATDT